MSDTSPHANDDLHDQIRQLRTELAKLRVSHGNLEAYHAATLKGYEIVKEDDGWWWLAGLEQGGPYPTEFHAARRALGEGKE